MSVFVKVEKSHKTEYKGEGRKGGKRGIDLIFIVTERHYLMMVLTTVIN